MAFIPSNTFEQSLAQAPEAYGSRAALSSHYIDLLSGDSQNQVNQARSNDGALMPLLPALTVAGTAPKPHDIVFNAKNGCSDVVAGINPSSNESLPDLIKRLHPDLPPEQVAKEVQHVLQYNRGYGNDLGDGMVLNADRPVYLPSIEVKDGQNRVTRIEGPTGRITDIAYDTNGMSGYRITNADGSLAESAQRNSDGSWQAIIGGKTQQVSSVKIDKLGDIALTLAGGFQLTHLTRGDDVMTSFNGLSPVNSQTVRDGKVTSSYAFKTVGTQMQVYAQFADNPTSILLNDGSHPDALGRVDEALGLDESQEPDSQSGDAQQDEDWQLVSGTNDKLPDQFGVRLLRMLGMPVTESNIKFLDAWQRAEGGSADNPFNTTWDLPGATNFNSVGVKRYRSVADGLTATVNTLRNGLYDPILKALRDGDDPMAAAQAVASSPWGTGSGVEAVLRSGTDA